MRVLSTFDNRAATTEKSHNRRKKGSGPVKVNKSYRPPKENLSPEEIKARVAKETAPKVKKVDITAGKQVSTFMSGEKKPVAVKAEISKKATTLKTKESVEVEKEDKKEEKNIMLKSDVTLNDPEDPNTRKKLQGLLNTGGFGWNEKERAALADILGKD